MGIILAILVAIFVVLHLMFTVIIMQTLDEIVALLKDVTRELRELKDLTISK